MKKHIITLVLFICFSGWIKSQTVLEAGDIAFVGINSSGSSDEFAFVLLQDIDGQTSINFTDCGWSNDTGFTQIVGDSHFTWTSDNPLNVGTVIIISTNNGNTVPQTNIGSTTGSKMLISIAGDQIFAYQGTVQSPKFIAAISYNQKGTGQPAGNFDGIANSNSNTELPASLTIGLNAIHLYDIATFAQQNNGSYNGAVTSGGKDDILQAINNVENWNLDNTTPYPISTFSFPFDVQVPTSIEEVKNNDSQISLYPNPATEGFWIKGIDQSTKLTILDVKGATAYSKQISNNEYISVSSLPKGTYIIQLKSNRQSSNHKLIVK